MVNKIEPNILIAAKNGSLQAFENILATYEQAIFGYIYRLVGQKEDAEDITQEVFIKLYKNISKLDLELKFSSWLYKIATNTAYDWLRKKQRRHEFLFLDDENRKTKLLDTIADPQAISAIETIEKQPAFDQITNALKNLKVEYRSVLLLFYYQEFSYQEISDALSLPINTVKTYLHRGKTLLKNKLTNLEV